MDLLFGQSDEMSENQPTLGLDDGAGLRVVKARFVSQRKFDWELFAGLGRSPIGALPCAQVASSVVSLSQVLARVCRKIRRFHLRGRIRAGSCCPGGEAIPSLSVP